MFKHTIVRVFVGGGLLLWGLVSIGQPLFWQDGVAFWSPKLSAVAALSGVFILILPWTFVWPSKADKFDEDRQERIDRMAEEKRRQRKAELD